jgi:hypothetical protein
MANHHFLVLLVKNAGTIYSPRFNKCRQEIHFLAKTVALM